MYWRMNKKHEDITDKELVYCFVYADKITKKYRLFFVPSENVAKYVNWAHLHWLNATHKHPVKDNDMRTFRINVDETSPYENNFAIFE